MAQNRILLKRIQGEIKLLEKNRTPAFQVVNDPDDFHNFYFLLRPDDVPYKGGLYLGKITISDDYPAKPPTFMMLTPSGRFEIQKTICLTNSHYHPESATPVWNMYTNTLGLLSIFMDDTTSGISHLKDNAANRTRMALESYSFNCKHHPKIFTMFNYFINDDLSLKTQQEIDAIMAPKKKKKKDTETGDDRAAAE
jgi:ubiquitin-protein ligase